MWLGVGLKWGVVQEIVGSVGNGVDGTAPGCRERERGSLGAQHQSFKKVGGGLLV